MTMRPTLISLFFALIALAVSLSAALDESDTCYTWRLKGEKQQQKMNHPRGSLISCIDLIGTKEKLVDILRKLVSPCTDKGDQKDHERCTCDDDYDDYYQDEYIYTDGNEPTKRPCTSKYGPEYIYTDGNEPTKRPGTSQYRPDYIYTDGNEPTKRPCTSKYRPDYIYTDGNEPTKRPRTSNNKPTNIYTGGNGRTTLLSTSKNIPTYTGGNQRTTLLRTSKNKPINTDANGVDRTLFSADYIYTQ